MAVYLDCAATTPIDPRVREVVLRFLDEDFGNAGSRTHDYGQRARRAVEQARQQVAAVADASRGDVIFTSGATESNNLAILGVAAGSTPHPSPLPARGAREQAPLAPETGEGRGRGHIVTTAIEHHAVLEPVRELERRGFEVTIVQPEAGGFVDAQAMRAAIRPDTLLVSMMHVNNETGVVQPVAELASLLEGDGHACALHVDAAQGFGKDLAALRHQRLDFISISGHKIGAPKGVGALVARRRVRAAHQRKRPALAPLAFGGGQELGLRPGTLAVPLIAGLGLAAELAAAECDSRRARCRAFRERMLAGLAPLEPVVNGDQARTLPNILNLTIPGIESDAAIEAWAELVAISNGAACTSQSYTCSHVLSAMGLGSRRAEGVLRFSWSHDSTLPDLAAMVEAIKVMRVQVA